MTGTPAERRLEMSVDGRVQGVCFRAETRRAARALGVEGIVRNLPDGSVHVIAEGEEESLMRLMAYCRVGPPGAVVTDLKYIWKEASGTFEGFEITR